MCGIAGAIGAIDAAAVESLRRVSEAQSHRGPDDSGLWSSCANDVAGNGAAFAFRRLAIIDLSPQGRQPMLDPASGNVLVFNGEIYNYRELRGELAREGMEFRSQSDSEVLLKAYGRWGLDALRKLRGMFALAIWDARRRRVVLARDRIGIKPLYYTALDRPDGQPMWMFASELRALVHGAGVRRRLNPAAVRSYLWNGFVIADDSIIEGVRILPAGTWAEIDVDSGQLTSQRYWQIPPARPSADGMERLADALRTSIEQHLVSDVPLGVFLSGGIDSSALAAMSARSAGSSLRTFTVGFDEATYDESHHARRIAKSLGVEHAELRLTQAQFRSHLNDALSGIDQPTFDAINTYFVSRAVREAGITVALAGTGGDELFGGYRSFAELPRVASMARSLALMPEPAVRVLGHAITRLRLGRWGEVPPQTRWGKLADALATRGRLVDLYQTSYAFFTKDFTAKLLNGPLSGELRCGLPPGVAAHWQELIEGQPMLHAISMLELASYVGERLLRDTDCASMAVSLEARVPLLDHEVIEAAAAVDLDRRFQPLGRKAVLRSLALEELDPKFFDRPKSGFELPIDHWCRHDLRGEVESALCDGNLCAQAGLEGETVAKLWRAFEAGAPGLYWSRVWSLFVLLWWCRTHNASI